MFAIVCYLLLRSVAVLGCNANSSWVFDATNHSNQTLGTRSFWVHVPPSYNASTAHPLVVSFHGYDEDERIHEEATGFSKEKLLIAGKGLIAVYPLAAYGPGKFGKFGKPARAWTGAPYASPEADDLSFVLAMLDALQDNLCIDKRRIYAAGMSNGGGFANLLACTPHTRLHFAAFAPVSPALYAGTHPFSPNCTVEPSRPVPVITFHGTADDVIPYEGRTTNDTPPVLGPAAERETTPSIAEWVGAWAERNACNSSSASDSGSDSDSASGDTGTGGDSTPYAGATETTWACSGQVEVKAFVIDNGTHRWPSTVGENAGPYSFNATEAQIVPFFASYSASVV
ncbi:alpha/beta-hydrolase [Mycena amicta]|nr:alpha/beta-hydrolase [Mycena amicta]